MMALREYGMQAAIAMAGAALLFDLAASFVILVVCLSTRAEKKSANMQASSGLVAFIWRESIVYWLVVLVLHSVNMSVAANSDVELRLLNLRSTSQSAMLITGHLSGKEEKGSFVAVTTVAVVLFVLRISLNLRMHGVGPEDAKISSMVELEE